MENNVNNNIASNTNVNNNIASNTNVVNNTGIPTNGGVPQTGVAPVTPVAPVQTVAPIQPVAPTVTQNVNPTGANNEQKSYKKFYIWMGIIVGLVLLIAGILLFFLLNGSIENRNRLTCTKTTQEEGYDYSIRRYYTFDNDKMVRVYYTYTFEYDNEITDDFYNETFNDIINIDNNVGSTKYGLSTSIQRKDNNIVEITSYEPNYYDEDFKEIKSLNKKDGYSCE